VQVLDEVEDGDWEGHHSLYLLALGEGGRTVLDVKQTGLQGELFNIEREDVLECGMEGKLAIDLHLLLNVEALGDLVDVLHLQGQARIICKDYLEPDFSIDLFQDAAGHCELTGGKDGEVSFEAVPSKLVEFGYCGEMEDIGRDGIVLRQGDSFSRDQLLPLLLV
jgi:hypothetical protein